MGKEENVTLWQNSNRAAVGDAENDPEKFDGTHNTTSNKQILFITSYSPRECGIAIYSQNLIHALNNRFNNFYSFKVCALEFGEAKYYYPEEVAYHLNFSEPSCYKKLVAAINSNNKIETVVIQHEFDLFENQANNLIRFLYELSKPVIVAFHTVVPNPFHSLKQHVKNIGAISKSVIVMAQQAAVVLVKDYQIPISKIEVIPYGTHLVTPANKALLKEKYHFTGKFVLTSFGLLTPTKGIETTLEAMPAVIKQHPDIQFLVVGKTHPEVLKKDGEKYRIMLEGRVSSLKLQNHVKFLNCYLTQEILKEYLQLTDICLFTCTDPNRAMSGTFSFASSCGCSIISTAIPHASELLSNNAGIIIENNNPETLSGEINRLLDDPPLRTQLGKNIARKAVANIWENSALAHGMLFNQLNGNKQPIEFKYPPLDLKYLKLLTDRFGMRQCYSPGDTELQSEYSLDDNTLALVVYCMHFKITGDVNDILQIKKYLKFIYYCFEPSGIFVKYLDPVRKDGTLHHAEVFEDTQARAVWALGFMISLKSLLPFEMIELARLMLKNVIPRLNGLVSARSIAFAIKGLYYYYSVAGTMEILTQIKSLADKLISLYKSNSHTNWKWFEEKFTHTGGVIPGALLKAWLLTDEKKYLDYAKESFDFLTSKTFSDNGIVMTSSQDWSMHNQGKGSPGEQPADIAIKVITYSKFYLVCKENQYFNKMTLAFNWFLGNNRLRAMVYNPVTGSCFDGFTEDGINLGQSAESALSYTLARMVVEKYKFKNEDHILL